MGRPSKNQTYSGLGKQDNPFPAIRESEQGRVVSMRGTRGPTDEEIEKAVPVIVSGESYLHACMAMGSVTYKRFQAWYNNGQVQLDNHDGDVDKIEDKYHRQCAKLVRAFYIARSGHAVVRELIPSRMAMVDSDVERIENPDGTIRERDMARRIRELEDKLAEKEAQDDGY